MKHGFFQGFGTGPGSAAGIPLAPVDDPAAYLAWKLRYQQPLDGISVPITASYQWQFDSLTDLVASETLAEVGTVPLTTFATTPESTVNPSQLATGYASFSSVGDALDAATNTVQDINQSALIAWCLRLPVAPSGTMSAASKRLATGDFAGFESAHGGDGKMITTFDSGAASVVLQLTKNYALEITAGAWHWFALLVDGPGLRCMIATDSEISPWTALSALPSSTELFSLGAGRLQSLQMDVLAQYGWFGSQLDDLFTSPTEAISGTNPAGPNIRDNVLGVLALETIRALPSTVL